MVSKAILKAEKKAMRIWKSQQEQIKVKKAKEKKAWEKLKKRLSKKVQSKRILKKSQATVKIKEHKPAEYVSRFFKDEMEEAGNAMFFK